MPQRAVERGLAGEDFGLKPCLDEDLLFAVAFEQADHFLKVQVAVTGEAGEGLFEVVSCVLAQWVVHPGLYHGPIDQGARFGVELVGIEGGQEPLQVRREDVGECFGQLPQLVGVVVGLFDLIEPASAGSDRGTHGQFLSFRRQRRYSSIDDDPAVVGELNAQPLCGGALVDNGLGVFHHALAPLGAFGMRYDIPLLVAVDRSHWSC